MDALSDADSCHRLGYDDFNESLSSKAAVRSVLALLGVSRAQIKGAETNDAFAALAVRAVWISQQLAALWKCSLARSMRQQLLSHHPPHTIISQQLLPRSPPPSHTIPTYRCGSAARAAWPRSVASLPRLTCGPASCVMPQREAEPVLAAQQECLRPQLLPAGSL